MSFLSPEKLLVVLVVALVVLGPERLPKVAHDIGRYWSEFQKFRQKLESEVRATIPNLPATSTITNAVRSPISFLDGLAASSNEKVHVPATASSPIDAGQSDAGQGDGATTQLDGATGEEPGLPARERADGAGSLEPENQTTPKPPPTAAAGLTRPLGPKTARRTWDDYGAVPDDPSLN